MRHFLISGDKKEGRSAFFFDYTRNIPASSVISKMAG